MAHDNTILKSFSLHGTREGEITVSNIDKPYGERSAPVASIGVSLTGGEPDWKVHIPYDQIDDICAALQEAKEKFGN